MEWLLVENFPDYSVSNLGQVRRDDSGNILSPQVNQYGNVFVGLMRNAKQTNRGLALLVARAFVPKPRTHFDTPINLNGDRFDCRVENLVWRPRAFARSYNMQFRERYFTSINEPVRECGLKQTFADSWAAAKHFGILEKDVVLSILENTVTWPTFQKFERII